MTATRSQLKFVTLILDSGNIPFISSPTYTLPEFSFVVGVLANVGETATTGYLGNHSSLPNF